MFLLLARECMVLHTNKKDTVKTEKAHIFFRSGYHVKSNRISCRYIHFRLSGEVGQTLQITKTRR